MSVRGSGERWLAWCTGRRVVQALLLLVAGSGALFSLGPYLKLKALTEGAVFPEEEITPPESLGLFLADIGEPGRALYMQSQFWDVGNALLIGCFALVLVGWVVRRSTEASNRSLLLSIPLVIPIAELIENGAITASIAAFPDASPLGGLLPVASAVKFGALAGTLFFVIILGGRGLVARLASRSDSRRGEEPAG